MKPPRSTLIHLKDLSDRELKALQSACMHQLRRIDVEYYRYECVRCGKHLRNASGMILPEELQFQ